MSWENFLAGAKKVAKAIAGAAVGAAAYLVGIGVGEGISLFDTIGSLDGAQWLGLIVFMGAGYGIVWSIPNSKS